MDPTLCLYRIPHLWVSSSLFFPKVRTLAVLQCSSESLHRLLTPSLFPHLQQIHFLSAPLRSDLLTRFPRSVEWVLPFSGHPFYDAVLQSGRGRIQPGLVSQYIAHVTPSDLILRIPPRTWIHGKHYWHLQSLWFHPCHSFPMDSDEKKERDLYRSFFNHPDATPFHS